jgi:hypothetical protein
MDSSKRARTVQPISFEMLDLSKVVAKFAPEKKGEAEYTDLLFYEDPARLTLTPAGSLQVVSGLDMVGEYEKISVNSPGTPAKKLEFLTLRVKLTPELDDFFGAFDKAVRELCRASRPDYHDRKWVNSIKEWTSKAEGAVIPTLRVRVGVTGERTSLKVPTHEPDSGKGWEYLKGASDAVSFGNGFFRAAAKIVVTPKLYDKDGKVGLTYFATQLALKPSERGAVEEVDVFAGADDF